jgi:hypothetical protein
VIVEHLSTGERTRYPVGSYVERLLATTMSIKSRPLFQKTVLAQHLSQMKRQGLKPRFEQLDIVAAWRGKLSSGYFRGYTETQIEQAFNSSIFGDVLGYVPMSSSDSGHHILPKPAATSRDFPDFVLGTFNPGINVERWRVVGEIKGPDVSLDLPQTSRANRETPVEQGFRYALARPGVEWVVITNFKEVRLYRNGYTGAWHAWKMEDLAERDKFYEFWALLRQPSLCPDYGTSDTLRVFERSVSVGEALTEGFYGLYDLSRATLVAEMRTQPSCEGLSEVELHGKSHKLLNRILFAAFCQDHAAELLPRNTLKRIYDQARVEEGVGKFWRQYQRFFRELDKGSPPSSPFAFNAFNGGLFAPDRVLDGLTLPDVLFTKKLVYESGRGSKSREISGIFGFYVYNFADELDVDSLGAIFEQSLKDITSDEAVRGAGTVGMSEREKSGVYYTPPAITELLVSRALRPALARIQDRSVQEARSTRSRLKAGRRALTVEEAKQLKSLSLQAAALEKLSLQDPACGSGAFLVEAYHQLWNEYNSLNVAIGHLAGAEPLFGLDKLILRGNLHGSDLLQESVEITRLSLWLRTASKTQPLEKLDGAVLTLDSLRDNRTDIFDIVVSNPPWGAKLAGWTREQIDAEFPEAGSERDSYAIFAIVAWRLLRENGILAFIIPNSWLTTAGYAAFREWILSKFEILEIVHVWKVFIDVNHDACLLVARKRPLDSRPSKSETTIIRRIPRGLSEQAKWQKIAEENWETTFTANPYVWSTEPKHRFETIYPPKVAAAIDEAFRGTKTLGEVSDVTVGIQVYHNSKVSKAGIKSRIFHSRTRDGKDWYPFISGNEVQRYFEEPEHKDFLLYSDSLRDKRPLSHYSEPRILIQQIFWNRLSAAISPPSAIPELYLNSLFSITGLQNPYTLTSVVAILNSRIYSACYERFANRLFGDKFPKVSKMDLASLPLPKLLANDIASLDESGRALSRLWPMLRASMRAFRDECNAIDGSGKLWKTTDRFWVLDREAVLQARATANNSSPSTGRPDFLEQWRESRDTVQTIWSNICESEKTVEETLQAALSMSPEVYEQLLLRVPKAKIEDALLPAL